MEMRIEPQIMKITNMRLLLHTTVYNNPEIVHGLINTLQNHFALFNIEYDEICKTIVIKIKKTDMKKNVSMFQHTSSFYYNIINEAFYEVFQNNIQYINSVIKQYKNIYGLEGNEINLFSNISNISLMYNATTQMDNIIVIAL